MIPSHTKNDFDQQLLYAGDGLNLEDIQLTLDIIWLNFNGRYWPKAACGVMLSY
jgi:hypothetical protein